MSYEVCIVDDEAGIGDLCRDYLSDSYSVKVFHSPEEALKAFDGNYHADIILTDIKMPGMDGFQMAKQIHNKAPAVPVVMMSGYAEKKHLIEAMDNDAVGFIEKPFSLKKMRATLDTAIRKSRHMQALELLNRKYEALVGVYRELCARYVERYAEAENRLLQADTFHHPNVQEALEFLMKMRMENRLNTDAERLLKEIEDLQVEVGLTDLKPL